LHAQLWANLRAARDLVAYPQSAAPQRPAGDDWPPWLPRPSPAWLSNAALFLYSAAWGAVALWLVLRRRYWLLAACSIFLTAALLAGFLGFLEHRSADDATLPLAVVRLNGLTLRQGNGSLYPRHTELPIVQRGMEARLLSRRGGWVQLQFPAGEVGWLPSSAVCVDE
jgi:hypothetical protein